MTSLNHLYFSHSKEYIPQNIEFHEFPYPEGGELMIQHGVGCRTEQILEIKKIDEDFFQE